MDLRCAPAPRPRVQHEGCRTPHAPRSRRVGGVETCHAAVDSCWMRDVHQPSHPSATIGFPDRVVQVPRRAPARKPTRSTVSLAPGGQPHDGMAWMERRSAAPPSDGQRHHAPAPRRPPPPATCHRAAPSSNSIVLSADHRVHPRLSPDDPSVPASAGEAAPRQPRHLVRHALQRREIARPEPPVHRTPARAAPCIGGSTRSGLVHTATSGS